MARRGSDLKRATLTRRGWGFLGTAIVAFIGAYAGGRQELLFVACLLAALPVVALVFVRARRPRIAVSRSFRPNVIQAGETASVTLNVRNTASASSMPARWWDAVPWHPFATSEAWLPALLPRGPRFDGRGNSVVVGYDVRPPHRGVFDIGPVSIEVTDAFGLAMSRLVVDQAQSLTVTPEVFALGDTGLSIPAGEGESRLVQRKATGDDDDVMTREYRDGDAMRRVHWRASARHGDLMVRQEEQRSFPEARILVDTARSSYLATSLDERDVATESPAFEWVVRMLASVSVHLRRSGFLVTIAETGPEQLGSFGRGRRRSWGDEQFLARLASFELTRATKNLGTRGRGSTGPLVALCGVPEPEAVEWMLAQRRPGELAVAFMVQDVSALDVLDRTFGLQGSGPEVAERFENAGWLVVAVRSDDDHATAWDSVVVETGRSRGKS
jgi:uncharacterized protein (DUF58 family)